nr:hypothetical protein [Tanacetum cinerariifolium]
MREEDCASWDRAQGHMGRSGEVDGTVQGNRVMHNISKPLPLGGPLDFRLEELVPSLWIESERDYDIKHKEFYIIRHGAPSDRNVVRSHMRILSVVSLKIFSRYGYTYLKEIVLRRADYKEYKISKADFKNLHRNDFEDIILKIITAEGEIDNLTMKQYLALTRGNQSPGVVKPKIGGNVNFEIKSQFMRELRKYTFFKNKNDDAHEHVERVLDIVSLFNILEVSHDAVMLRVFLITLTGAAKQCVDRLPPETIRDETLYQAWEQYNDLLYKCPTHDINSHKKVNIFYNGLGTMNRQLHDSQGPIPGMTPTQALTAIENMADHSQKWHDGSSNRIIDSSESEGIVAIINKLENLGRDMKK